MIKINISNSKKIRLEEYHYNAIYNGLGKKKSLESFISDEFNSKFTLKDFLIGDKVKTLEIIALYATPKLLDNFFQI